MEILNRKVRDGFTKAVSALTGVTTILSLSGLLAFAPVAGAVAPADYSLKEGDTISAAGSSDPDVYIVNEMGYKRLFLNPVIFGFYAHLGGFAKVKSVSPATRDAFVTSGLFRNCETGDQKVYGVESTGEDTAMLHWVNTSGSQAVADDPNFFKKVFCINSNEFNWYTKSATDYASVNQVPNYSRVAGATPAPAATGPLSVSLSPSNPGAMTVTTNAQGVEVMKVRFSGSGTVNSMTFKRGGAGSTDDYDNLYIYDGATRLTSGKSLSSSTGEITLIGLATAVSGTKDLSLVADLSATAGNVDYFTLSAVGTASGTVGGLPIVSNNMSVSGATSGGVTITKVGALGNPNVGQKGAQLSEFKVAANTEGASIKRITMLQGGTVKGSDMTNVKLTTGTNTWSGTVTSDAHLVFDMGSGFFIAKGGNTVFQVWGDVAGKSTETLKLYFEEVVDVLAIGDQYGYAMDVTDTAMDSTAATESHNLTLQGGILTLTFNGPNTSNIGTTTDDTVLMRYAITAATNIEIKKTKWDLCLDASGDGTYDDANNSSGWGDLVDFKVTDEDSGVTIMGPQDGSAFTTSDTDSCPNAKTGAQKQFTDVFDLAAGKTRNFKVTADIKTSNTGGQQISATAGDKLKIILDSYAAAVTSSGDLTIMKYTGTNTAVLSTDIVPSADVSGNEFTVQSASLTLGLAGSPASQTYVKGTKNVDVVGITFAAAQASDLRVTDITLTGYASDDTTTFDEGTDVTDTAVSVANAMSNLRLVEAETGTVIADANRINSNNLSTQNTGTVKFSFAATPWTIKAGATRTLLVRTDLSTNAVSGSAGDGYSFDIAATANVTALDSASNTVNAANQVVNGTTSPTKVLTVKSAGSMTLAAHSDSPTKGALYWGQVDAPVSKFNLTSTNEAFSIENFTIAASAGASNGSTKVTDAKNSVKQVKLTYKNKAGSVLTTVQSFTSGASSNFGWSYSGSGTDTRPYVPKDGSLAIDVAASLRTKADGATPTNASPEAVFFSLDLVDSYNGSYTTAFKAVGEGSGTVLDGTSTGINDVVGANDQYVYRVFPKIEQVALPSPYSLTGTPTIFKFSVTAMGLSDSTLRFDNEARGSGSIYFEVVSSGEHVITNASTTYSIYDENQVLIDASAAIRRSNAPGSANTSQNVPALDTLPAVNASIIFDFTSKDVEITGGQTKTFRIQLDNPNTNYAQPSSTGRAADYFQVELLDDQAGLINWVEDYNNATTAHDTASTTGVLRSVPLYGPTFTR